MKPPQVSCSFRVVYVVRSPGYVAAVLHDHRAHHSRLFGYHSEVLHAPPSGLVAAAPPDPVPYELNVDTNFSRPLTAASAAPCGCLGQRTRGCSSYLQVWQLRACRELPLSGLCSRQKLTQLAPGICKPSGPGLQPRPKPSRGEVFGRA